MSEYEKKQYEKLRRAFAIPPRKRVKAPKERPKK